MERVELADAGPSGSAEQAGPGGEPFGPHVPPCGAFEWRVRALAPGLDASAVHALAVKHEYVTEDGGPAANDATGPIAEFMAQAFACAYDRVVAFRLGLTTDANVPDVEALLAFGYAACVRTAGGAQNVRPAGEQ